MHPIRFGSSWMSAEKLGVVSSARGRGLMALLANQLAAGCHAIILGPVGGPTWPRAARGELTRQIRYGRQIFGRPSGSGINSRARKRKTPAIETSFRLAIGPGGPEVKTHPEGALAVEMSFRLAATLAGRQLN
jgi:hypothetical protein